MTAVDAVKPRTTLRVTAAIALGVAAVLGLGAALYLHARAQTNDVAVASTDRPVTVVEARAGTYQAKRRYVATVEPWVQAAIGPQLIAAYADSVLVRPGSVVQRGEVLATLDCRDASSAQRAISMQARAIDAKQRAMASEAARVTSLLDGGFVAANEAEQKTAGSEGELAELMAAQAKLAGSTLAVSDCVLRAPFDGEVSERKADPGAFIRPGTTVVTVIDRSTVRVTADVPEGDFTFVGKGTSVSIRMLATGATTSGVIARRSPQASSSTRTVHIEIDLADPQRDYPVGTTAELFVPVASPRPATVIPLVATTIRGDKATLFVVEGDRAKRRVIAVQGEEEGQVFLDPALRPGTSVVTEGRSLLSDDDKVAPHGLATKGPTPGDGASP